MISRNGLKISVLSRLSNTALDAPPCFSTHGLRLIDQTSALAAVSNAANAKTPIESNTNI